MAKAKKRSKKRQPQSKYMLVRLFRKSKKDTIKTLEGYREKLITDPIDNGKAFWADLATDPGQAIVDLVKEGHEFTVKIRRDTRKKAQRWMDAGSGFTRDLAKNPSKAFIEAVDDGRAFAKDIRAETERGIRQVRQRGLKVARALQKDVTTAADGALQRGRALVNKPVRGVEERLNRRLSALPDRLNLARKQDIERMGKVLRKLDGKIDRLNPSAAA